MPLLSPQRPTHRDDSCERRTPQRQHTLTTVASDENDDYDRSSENNTRRRQADDEGQRVTLVSWRVARDGGGATHHFGRACRNRQGRSEGQTASRRKSGLRCRSDKGVSVLTLHATYPPAHSRPLHPIRAPSTYAQMLVQVTMLMAVQHAHSRSELLSDMLPSSNTSPWSDTMSTPRMRHNQRRPLAHEAVAVARGPQVAAGVLQQMTTCSCERTIHHSFPNCSAPHQTNG